MAWTSRDLPSTSSDCKIIMRLEQFKNIAHYAKRYPSVFNELVSALPKTNDPAVSRSLLLINHGLEALIYWEKEKPCRLVERLLQQLPLDPLICLPRHTVFFPEDYSDLPWGVEANLTDSNGNYWTGTGTAWTLQSKVDHWDLDEGVTVISGRHNYNSADQWLSYLRSDSGSSGQLMLIAEDEATVASFNRHRWYQIVAGQVYELRHERYQGGMDFENAFRTVQLGQSTLRRARPTFYPYARRIFRFWLPSTSRPIPFENLPDVVKKYLKLSSPNMFWFVALPEVPSRGSVRSKINQPFHFNPLPAIGMHCNIMQFDAQASQFPQSFADFVSRDFVKDFHIQQPLFAVSIGRENVLGPASLSPSRTEDGNWEVFAPPDATGARVYHTNSLGYKSFDTLSYAGVRLQINDNVTPILPGGNDSRTRGSLMGEDILSPATLGSVLHLCGKPSAQTANELLMQLAQYPLINWHFDIRHLETIPGTIQRLETSPDWPWNDYRFPSCFEFPAYDKPVTEVIETGKVRLKRQLIVRLPLIKEDNKPLPNYLKVELRSFVEHVVQNIHAEYWYDVIVEEYSV